MKEQATISLGAVLIIGWIGYFLGKKAGRYEGMIAAAKIFSEIKTETKAAGVTINNSTPTSET